MRRMYRNRQSGMLLGNHPMYAGYPNLELVDVDFLADGSTIVVLVERPESDSVPTEAPHPDAPEGRMSDQLPEVRPRRRQRRK